MSALNALGKCFPAPSPAPDRRVRVVAPGGCLARELVASGLIQSVIPAEGFGVDHALDETDIPAGSDLVYVASPIRPPDLGPDLAAARSAFGMAHRLGVDHLVVLSNVAAYGATPHHAGLATEDRPVPPAGPSIARSWQSLELAAVEAFGSTRVTILRAAPTLEAGGVDYFSRLFGSRQATVVAGHDPTLQFLTPADLCRAVACALARRSPGVFNIVPASPIPFRKALAVAGCRAIPMPWTVHRAIRACLGPTGRVASGTQVQFARDHLTASGDKAARHLGFVARDSSAEAVRRVAQRDGLKGRRAASVGSSFDPFGLDRDYIDGCWRGCMGFLHRRYWRIETRGLEHIPRDGAGVLVGMHRGFMPFDGVMTLMTIVQETGRVPRFLIHPGVGLRFPFLFDLMSKLGGVIACQENADHVLRAGELLGVYPEGIRGAFTFYKHAHRIGPSWRNDCITFALRHRVPVLPFVTVGSAEIFPILGRLDWRWWKKHTEWPFIPITTPVPLPSKWHTLFLEPLHVEREYPAHAAEDPAVVRAIGSDLKRRMERAVADLVRRRRSIFRGSVFGGVS